MSRASHGAAHGPPVRSRPPKRCRRRPSPWKGASVVGGPADVHDRAMSATNASRITLELMAGADPIRGSIEHADGRSQPFWGWLELIEVLQRAAADRPERNAPPTPGRKPQPAGEEHS